MPIGKYLINKYVVICEDIVTFAVEKDDFRKII